MRNRLETVLLMGCAAGAFSVGSAMINDLSRVVSNSEQANLADALGDSEKSDTAAANAESIFYGQVWPELIIIAGFAAAGAVVVGESVRKNKGNQKLDSKISESK